MDGVQVIIERVSANRYRLTSPDGQSIEIAAVGILEIAAYSEVESEAIEIDARQEIRSLEERR